MDGDISNILCCEVEDYSNYRKERKLAKLAETERRIKKDNNGQVHNWHRLHDYWTERPILRMFPTLVAYSYYKVRQKI